jgi:3-hydroxybutyrate dehydrogenase
VHKPLRWNATFGPGSVTVQAAMLQDKTALVTGSTSGIGLAIAQALAQRGARIVLNGFGDAQVARDAVSRFGTPVGYHGADLTRPNEIEGLIRYATREFGGVDILVNNAGIQYVAPVDEFPVEKWDAIIATNLSAAFHTTRLALPGMKAKNWGRVINIASVQGLIGSVEKSAYVAAKHGLVGFTKAVALETATSGVTVNAICPGFVWTAIVQSQVEARAAKEGVDVEEAKRRLLAEKQPSRQFVTTEQIGELAAFLCSDAAANVRGVAWNIDGGWVAQ